MVHKQVCPYKSNSCIRLGNSMVTLATKNRQSNFPGSDSAYEANFLGELCLLLVSKHADH